VVEKIKSFGFILDASQNIYKSKYDSNYIIEIKPITDFETQIKYKYLTGNP